MDQGKATGGQPDRVTRGYVVSGRVQGVGFRYFVLRQAELLGLAGWVRNLDSGQVEVRALGTRAQHDSLEQVLRKGPRFSAVTDVEKSEISGEVDDVSGFHIID